MTKNKRGLSSRQGISDQQYKDGIKALKKAGLYSGDLRKAPTDYAKRQVRKYQDVIRGTAEVVKVPVTKSGRASGKVAARKEAQALARAFPTTVKAKGDRIIVRKMKGQKVTYSKKDKTLIVTEGTGDKKWRYEYLRNLKIPTLEKGQLPQLGQNMAYALPFSRGRDGVEYVTRATPEEIEALIFQYETKTKNPYRGAQGYIMIGFRGDDAWKRRKTLKPIQTGANVIPFPGRK